MPHQTLHSLSSTMSANSFEMMPSVAPPIIGASIQPSNLKPPSRNDDLSIGPPSARSVRSMVSHGSEPAILEAAARPDEMSLAKTCLIIVAIAGMQLLDSMVGGLVVEIRVMLWTKANRTVESSRSRSRPLQWI